MATGNESNTPLVSVNIPAYNTAEYIAEAIQSVLNQTYLNWELIIINDCSTDSTATEISKFNDPRIKVFHNEQNEGIVYSRNRALHYSTGKYIAVLDSDDYFLPDKLQIQVDFMENNPDYGMVGGGFRYIYEETKTQSEFLCWYAKAEYFPTILLFNNFFNHSTSLFLSSLAKKILYKPLVRGFSPSEEYQLFVQISRTHKIYNINKEFAAYRRHHVNISSTREDKINEYIDIIVKDQLKWLNIIPNPEELELHKSIRFAFDHLEWKHIRSINLWIKKLLKQNKAYKIYDRYFEEYLALKWYEIAKFNANFGIRMLFLYYSSSLSLHPIIDFEKRKFLLERCLYEFKRNLF